MERRILDITTQPLPLSRELWVDGKPSYQALADKWLGQSRGYMGLKNMEAYLEGMMYREPMVCHYGFAVPNIQALRAITSRGKNIVEIGAGGGYWAALLSSMGSRVSAFDIAPGADNGYNFTQNWHPVQSGGAPMARGDYDMLFLCWPPLGETMDIDALEAFQGKYVAYVGEMGGCTGSERFEEAIKDWERIDTQVIPTWPGIHDYLQIYQRPLGPG